MGLLTKKVKMILHNKNINYYEDLGYDIPRYKNSNGRMKVKRGTEIIVNVLDLPDNSKIEVETECDCCKKIKKMPFYNYVKINHDEKTYCRNCWGKMLVSGENNGNWNSEKTNEERENDRSIPGYKEFIQRVLNRDNFTCRCCYKKCHGDANVHHLDSYDWCISKRTNDDNGITLCEICHKNFHLIYGYGNNTVEQFEEWFGKAIDILQKYNGKLFEYKKIYCIEENKIYESYIEFAEVKNCHVDVPYKCCKHITNSALGLHLLFLDEYEKMSDDEIEQFVKNHKIKNRKNNNYYRQPIVCINNNLLFSSISNAMKWCGYKSTGGFYDYFRGKSKSVGKHPETGEKLQWMYYEDYIKLYGKDMLEEYVI